MRLGCQICIDDFGTGYSSLSYLTLFQLSKIKIDRSFVSKLPDDKYSLKLLEAVYDIARSFEIDAIPEGVENAKQLQILSMIGYKFFQGYYLPNLCPSMNSCSVLIRILDDNCDYCQEHLYLREVVK